MFNLLASINGIDKLNSHLTGDEFVSLFTTRQFFDLLGDIMLHHCTSQDHWNYCRQSLCISGLLALFNCKKEGIRRSKGPVGRNLLNIL